MNMKKIGPAAGVLLAAFLAQPTMAAQPKYGMAGCGLGSMLFEGKNDKLSQVGSWIVTQYIGFQTSAISSGTSNCTTEGITSADFAKVFIDSNRNPLEVEMARGEGQTLNALTELMGCQDSAAAAVALQKNYTSIFSSKEKTSEQIQQDVRQSLKAHAQNACQKLI